MAYARWVLQLAGKEQIIELDHNLWTTRRRVWVNGLVQIDQTPISTFPCSYQLKVPKARTTPVLRIRRHLFFGTFYYTLEVGGKSLKPSPERERLLLPTAKPPSASSELLRPVALVGSASELELMRPAQVDEPVIDQGQPIETQEQLRRYAGSGCLLVTAYALGVAPELLFLRFRR